MRINSEQIAIIRQTAQESFGPEALVWLFGSRVDDGNLGGDVELGNIVEHLGAGNEYNESKSDTPRRDESLTAV